MVVYLLGDPELLGIPVLLQIRVLRASNQLKNIPEHIQTTSKTHISSQSLSYFFFTRAADAVENANFQKNTKYKISAQNDL